MDEGTTGTRLLRGNQRKAVLALAGPIAVALLVQQANNIVDSLWVSGLGAGPLAAIGAIYPVYCVLIGIGNGLGVGASAAIAKSIGFGKKDDAVGSAAQALIITVIVSVAATIILMPTAGPLAEVIGAGDVEDDCLAYAHPIYLCSFLIILSGVLSGMLRGEGNAKRSMAIQVAGAVTNIILDPVLIYGLDMGVAGAAWATCIAFAVSCAIGLHWYITGKGMFVRLEKKDFRPDRRLQRMILSVGTPEAIELSVMNFFNLVLYTFVTTCGGTEALSIYATSWRVAYVLMVPAQAVGGAMVAACSSEYAMGRNDMVRDAFRFSLKVSILTMACLAVILIAAAGPIATVFTHADDMGHLTGEMTVLLRVMAVFLPVMSMVYTGSSLMQALDSAKGAMFNSLGRNLLLVALFASATALAGTLDSLWLALAVGEVTGGLMMAAHALTVLKYKCPVDPSKAAG